MPYEAVIGLEVHAQLKTKSKAFCSCSTEFGQDPNAQVCPICVGMPGMLPVLNAEAVELAIRAGLALNCTIAERTKFDRKNYFYADLPKGYQISQYDEPICTSGHLVINGKTIRINRAHMEEDAGKLVHAGAAGLHGSSHTLVDYNRSGVPLLEIVSEPDLDSAELARDYLTELRSILRYLDVCDGNLERGSFRCDANVSLREVGAEKLGTKAEVKNVNSFKAVYRAIQYEIERQEEILSSGGTVKQESRLWDEASGKTYSMRSKEDAHDYRYFPEPDLTPVAISQERVQSVKDQMPELPEQRRKRYHEQYQLSEGDAAVIVENKDMSDFYDQFLKLADNQKASAALAKTGSNYLIGPATAYSNDNKLEFSQLKMTAQALFDLVAAVESGKLGSTGAKKLLVALLENGGDVKTLIDQMGLAQVSDTGAIEAVVLEVLERSQAQVEEYKQGKVKVRQYFFGEIMKAMKGKTDPKVANELLDKHLPPIG
ncbi:Asp-tRNA(Asn)/Glu-tRNA(Gln) amidotransferase subunit GatB [bacterium]|nr:Asp-tRNA(Asn)/Glu-tRNA(Gln) amidotransferase subunit GatB [bacterium]QQR56105.1 MAG: Asp-tRNA(Asn)/Glu-tRNA(Gln) amidotransferase subunit GatB [Candidatus Melainabacteria bacterium]